MVRQRLVVILIESQQQALKLHQCKLRIRKSSYSAKQK